MKNIAKEELYYGTELENKLGTALGEIQALVEKNNYVVENPDNLKAYMKFNYKNSIRNASKKTQKKLNRYIRFWAYRANRESANRLLHFLKTRVTAKRTDKKQGSGYYSWFTTIWESQLETVKILPSLKEQTIQKKREVWKKLRDESEKALQAYKKEKGDFYKAREFEKAQRKRDNGNAPKTEPKGVAA